MGLALPPKQSVPRRVLCCFSGSGSEMIGSMLAGWDEIVGVEMSAEYVAIAEKRLAFWSEQMKKHGSDIEAILKVAGRVKSAPIPPKESGRNILTPVNSPVEDGEDKGMGNQGELF